MKKEIAQLVLNSLVNNPTMMERAALMQERWGGIDLENIATPMVKRVLVDINGIQDFLNEKYKGFKITVVEVNVTSNKFMPCLNFREEHDAFWTPNAHDYWWKNTYSLEEREGWRRREKDWNNCTVEFTELGIPEELYSVEWL